MATPRIVFVPGMKPKPPPALYREQLCRVLCAALGTQNAPMAQRFCDRPECLTLVPWTHRFYGADRDLALDLPGIERLLSEPALTAEERQQIDAPGVRAHRLFLVLGDAWPWLGRRLVTPTLRVTMHEVGRYLKNVEGIGEEIRGIVKRALAEVWRERKPVLLIGHSLGSVIAYDALWELSREQPEGRVDLFLTLGSPLGTRFVRRRLRGAQLEGRERYPTNIRRWINFAARGETTALRPALRPHFREMVTLGLLESLVDHTKIYNHFHGENGLNVHEAYGYLMNPEVAATIADWLQSVCG